MAIVTNTKASRILIIGDLHADDVYEGKHKNYLQNTFDVMGDILRVVAERKPSLVVLAGDLVGVRPGRSKVRTRMYLQRLISFIRALGPDVIVVKGNHDYAEDSDYDFLHGIGVFKSPVDVGHAYDVVLSDKPDDRLRLHLRDYGKEYLPLELEGNEAGVNIVVAHNEFYIEGKEYRRRSDGALELIHHTPFYGADVVLSGHIHHPSPTIEDFTTLTGVQSAFVNLGCPTRPSAAENYNQVWLVELAFDTETSWSFNPIPFELKPADEVFVKSSDMFQEVKAQLEAYDQQRRLSLDNVLNTILESGPNVLDVKEQIKRIPSARQEAKDKALALLAQASSD